ncbi:MAG: hypothetical protein JWR51_1659 [Devosia sp.]|uniref:hypothetical protein n=1 Tax=Devosia sp. TaxID=1871048 RepID=UPI002624EB31|nr:hypothetical protein [Devosia sp.]MDB5528556.1 hypothetical protein [Devosia sp.]
MSELIFRYRHDPSFFDKDAAPDDFGYLTMSVTTERFSGCGSFWVQWQDVVEFGQSLATFPIQLEAPLGGKWGVMDQEGDNLALAVQIKPANSTGDLLVTVEIGELQHNGDRARISFLTNYPDIERFARSLARLMDGKIEQAVLTGQ